MQIDRLSFVHVACCCRPCRTLKGFVFSCALVFSHFAKILLMFCLFMYPALQMCFHCTRSSTCGTHCCWETRLFPSVSACPYCSSSGIVSWLMASMNASYYFLTCQVRIYYTSYSSSEKLYPIIAAHRWFYRFLPPQRMLFPACTKLQL